MAIGTVEWFNPETGYGFIAPVDNTSDIFVHSSAIMANHSRNLQEGQTVEYEVKDGEAHSLVVL
jgi:cold shock protein